MQPASPNGRADIPPVLAFGGVFLLSFLLGVAVLKISATPHKEQRVFRSAPIAVPAGVAVAPMPVPLGFDRFEAARETVRKAEEPASPLDAAGADDPLMDEPRKVTMDLAAAQRILGLQMANPTDEDIEAATLDAIANLQGKIDTQNPDLVSSLENLGKAVDLLLNLKQK
jgi:hypothetical protein